jgi:hypothetical protein
MNGYCFGALRMSQVRCGTSARSGQHEDPGNSGCRSEGINSELGASRWCSDSSVVDQDAPQDDC